MSSRSSKKILKKLSLRDLKKVFELSNDPVVRKWSLKKSRISIAKHKIWFKHELYRNNFFYKFVCGLKTFGIIRLSLKKKKYFLSYLIASEFRGRNLGSKMIKLFTNKIRKNRKIEIDKVFAVSFKKNISSNKTLKKSGFLIHRKTNNKNIYILNI